MKPDDPVAYYNRGLARGRLNDYSGAIKDFDRVIELNPEYKEAYYNRGIANFFIGRQHDACYDWRKAHSMGHYEADKAIKAYCEGEKK
jgi:lipoprotein NlpI